MKKPHVVMLGYNHHRHTSKATLYGKPVFLKEKKTRALYDYIYCTYIANLPNTARKLKNVTILSTPQQALWPMHIDQQTPSNL